MVRPLRIEYPGTVYHGTGRGNERKAISRTEADRMAFLETLARAREIRDPAVIYHILLVSCP
jgi:hypothetical protein